MAKMDTTADNILPPGGIRTRVQIINEAIFYLFITEERSAREIQRSLKDYNVELSLVEILTIIASFQYRPVVLRKPTATQVLRRAFKAYLDPVMRSACSSGVSNVKISLFLNYLGIPYPSSIPSNFTACKLESLLIEYKFCYPRKRQKLYLANEDMYKLIISGLTEAELNQLENWKNKNV